MSKTMMVYHEGWRLGLVMPAGRKYVPVVLLLSSGVKLVKLPRREEAVFRDPPGLPSKVKPARVARRWLKFGARFGITKAARDALRGMA